MKKILSIIMATGVLLFCVACDDDYLTESSDLQYGSTYQSVIEETSENTYKYADSFSETVTSSQTVDESMIENEETELISDSSAVLFESPSYSDSAVSIEQSSIYSGVADSSTNSVTVPQAETQGYLVWVPVNGGTKYHTNASCSNMKDPIQVSKETAVANGYEPCKRCYS